MRKNIDFAFFMTLNLKPWSTVSRIDKLATKVKPCQISKFNTKMKTYLSCFYLIFLLSNDLIKIIIFHRMYCNSLKIIIYKMCNRCKILVFSFQTQFQIKKTIPRVLKILSRIEDPKCLRIAN